LPPRRCRYDELTAEENLVFFARIHGLGGKALRARVDWALDFAELRDRRRDRTGGYSGGMRRRLNLVCALVHAPKVLLLDEPMAGVDPQSRNHLFERIEELQRAGMTILHTTHQMEEAHRLCRRVAIMDHGKILDAGTVEELIARHGDLSVVEATLERPPDDPARLPGTLDGTALRIETKRPLEEVAQLAAAGVRITSLNIHRPDLESVFLTLTGRKLRE